MTSIHALLCNRSGQFLSLKSMKIRTNTMLLANIDAGTFDITVI